MNARRNAATAVLLAAGAALILISGIYGIVQEKKKQDRLAEQFNASAMYR